MDICLYASYPPCSEKRISQSQPPNKTLSHSPTKYLREQGKSATESTSSVQMRLSMDA